MYFVRIFGSVIILLLCCANVRPQEYQNVVNISLYYESLCPACRTFDKEQLYPTYVNLMQYINLKLIPYGNAKRNLVDKKWVFTCQHGPAECYGNKEQACVLSNVGISDFQKISFVGCVMSSNNPASQQIGKACASMLGLNWNEINSCATGSKGDQLLAQNGEETDALNPPHKYVPWIIINGKYNSTMNDLARDNLHGVVCSLLDKKPLQCHQSESRFNNDNQEYLYCDRIEPSVLQLV